MPIFQPQSASSVPSFLINYMETNPDAESDNSGWTVSKNTSAASTPDSGFVTSGTNITWTRTTSSPIQGSGSFLLTKDAANRQGEQVYFPFTIRSGDKAKMLRMYVDYNIASGTYADDDLIFYIYDVTNSTFTQTAPYKIKNHSLASERFYLEFQTSSSSTSYRLLIHVSSTSASAYTLKFDNFVLGPNVKGYGSPVTDWVSYTPTITTGSGTMTNYTATGYWRRLGDSLELNGQIVFSGAAGTWANPYFSLPSGMTIDTAKLASTTGVQPFGYGLAVDSGSNYYNLNLVYNSTTKIELSQINVAGTYASASAVSQAVPFSFVSPDSLTWTARIPIVGWSSSVIMSSDADTRAVAAYYNGTITGSISASFSTITYGTKISDSHNAYSSGTYTIPVSGYYDVSASAELTATNTTYALLGIHVDGTLKVSQGYRAASTSASVLPAVSAKSIYLNAGQLLTIKVATNGTGGTWSTDFTGGPSHFAIAKVSGPSQIMASETISCRYTSTSGTSIANNSYTIQDFSIKDWDTCGSVTTGASWKFTANISGIYAVESISELVSGGWTAGEAFVTAVFKNGSQEVNLGGRYFDATITQNAIASGAAKVRLLAGDYIDIRLYQNSGASVNTSTTAALNKVSITRVGNY